MPSVRQRHSCVISPTTRAHIEHLYGGVEGVIEVLEVGESRGLVVGEQKQTHGIRPARRYTRDGPHQLVAGLPAMISRARRLCLLIALGMLPRAKAGSYGPRYLPGRAVWCDVDLYSMGSVPGSGSPQTIDELMSRREVGRRLLLTRLRGLAVQPSVVVNSGWGRHLIWYLDVPTCPVEIVTANRAIAMALAVTDATWDAARMLRVPGTSNHKVPSQQKLVRIIGYQPQLKYDTEHLRAAAEQLGPSSTSASVASTQAGAPVCGNTAAPASLHHRIVTILDGDHVARDLFLGRGKKGGDLSDSGYDMSLAIRLAMTTSADVTADMLATTILSRSRNKVRDLAYAHRTVEHALRWRDDRVPPPLGDDGWSHTTASSLHEPGPAGGGSSDET
jgi:hypothetical protein